MEILFLGTGAGMPAKYRNVTAIALKHLADGSVWLFDCGEATQHQILHTSIKPRKIDKIFITHLHGDHIFGLPGLLGSRSFLGGESPLTIYGPKGIREYVNTSLKISETHLRYHLDIEEIEEGNCYEDDHFQIEVKKLNHVLPSFGYRITEKDKPGALQVERLKEEGVKPGPLYKLLKEGNKVTLEDGRVLDGKDFQGPKKVGRIVTILGDTRPCVNSVDLAKNADVVIHEATFNKDADEMAYDYFHSTTHQAAAIALQANAQLLCITHISSRFEKKDWPILEKEAQEIFPNTIIAEDFKKVEVKTKE